MNTKLVNLTIVVAMVLAGTTSCKKARYGIIKPSRETAPEGFSDKNSSFRFEATPGTVSPNEPVAFKGICETEGTFEISWDYGDKSKLETGVAAKHAYEKIGTYTVLGTCNLANGRKLPASVKIQVVDPADVDQSNPTQRPAQSTPVQSSPTQSGPGQTPTQTDPGQN